MELRYLYVGAEDTDVELEAWLAAAGAARPRWRFQAFGADVAAVDMGSGPAVLVADHRPSGSVLPIYAVEDLDEARATLEAAGSIPILRRSWSSGQPLPTQKRGGRGRQAVRPSRWAASL